MRMKPARSRDLFSSRDRNSCSVAKELNIHFPLDVSTQPNGRKIDADSSLGNLTLNLRTLSTSACQALLKISSLFCDLVFLPILSILLILGIPVDQSGFHLEPDCVVLL